jgi:hypothetical protein
MNIKETIEAIKLLPSEAEVSFLQDAYIAYLCETADLKALAENHTRLLEAAKESLYCCDDEDYCKRSALLRIAIAEAE